MRAMVLFAMQKRISFNLIVKRYSRVYCKSEFIRYFKELLRSEEKKSLKEESRSGEV